MSSSTPQEARQYWLVYCPNIARSVQPPMHENDATKKLKKQSGRRESVFHAVNHTTEEICIGRRFRHCQACKAQPGDTGFEDFLPPPSESFQVKKKDKMAAVLHLPAIDVIRAFNQPTAAKVIRPTAAKIIRAKAETRSIPAPRATTQHIPAPRAKFVTVTHYIGNPKTPTPMWEDIFRQSRDDEHFQRQMQDWEKYKAENVVRNKYRKGPAD